MTETTPQTEQPAGSLMALIAALLAPMFLAVTAGDVALARLAAVETIKSYQARTHVDLIAIAQVIACGLAALGSLSRSMEDDLSLSMTLRLRGNAAALNRAAEQNRRALALAQTQPAAPDPDPSPTAEDAAYEAEVLAKVAATQKLTAETQNHPQDPEPAPPAANPALTDRQRQAAWAFAMTDVAAEFTADLAKLPPAERKLASRRAEALSTCANHLLLGTAPPLSTGDLAALLKHGMPP